MRAVSCDYFCTRSVKIWGNLLGLVGFDLRGYDSNAIFLCISVQRAEWGCTKETVLGTWDWALHIPNKSPVVKTKRSLCCFCVHRMPSTGKMAASLSDSPIANANPSLQFHAWWKKDSRVEIPPADTCCKCPGTVRDGWWPQRCKNTELRGQGQEKEFMQKEVTLHS
jgi:hypothetical protein